MTKYVKLGEEVTVFFTNKEDGSMSVKDNEDQGLENRRKVFNKTGTVLERAVFCQQTHSDNILVVDEKDTGAGSINFHSGVPDTDALITKERGIPLMILVADCVPVLLYDPVKKIVGAVHAGWRGTVKRILEKTVHEMCDQFDCDPTDILAVIGPSIGPNCFEVGEEVIAAAKDASLENFIIRKDAKNYFDLWASNKYQLTSSGTQEENVLVSEVCNHCSSEYFSYRRDNNTLRFAAGIVLK